MNDLVARVLRREYFVLGWLSNLPKKENAVDLLHVSTQMPTV